MDVSVALLGLLSRRLPFTVPTPKGFVALSEGCRAVVYPYIAGRPLDFAQLPGGPGIAAELGRALAALHNLDLAVCEEAGLTSYDPDTYRTRRLADLDRAAATGHVPTGLLSRWEQSLEDVSLWRFAPTPTHGDLTGDEVLAVFNDEDDATSGHIRGLTGWEDAKVADPADDFATLVTQAPPSAFDSVLEAYAHARVDRPDKYLERRARLAGELKLVSELLTAVGSRDQSGIESCAERLRRLDARTFGDKDDEPVVPTAPTVPRVTDDSGVPEHPDTAEGSNAPEHSGATEHSNTAEARNATEHSEVAEHSSTAEHPAAEHPAAESPDGEERFDEAKLDGKVQAVDDPTMTPSG
jgi:macrolide phosphotransferase